MQKHKHSFIFGAVTLIACNLISKAIGAVYRIPLLKILGSEGLGLYQLIFPLFALMLVVSSSGVNVAVSKFVSQQTSKHNRHNINKYLRAGFIVSVCVSLFFTLVLAAIVPLISKYQGDSRLSICYYAILPSIVVCSLLSTFKGYFLGKHKMIYSGGLQVAEQVLKLVLGLLFAGSFIKNGLIYAVFGTVLGVTTSEVLTLILAFLIYLFDKKSIRSFAIIKAKKQNIRLVKTQTHFLAENQTCVQLKTAIKQIIRFGVFVSLESSIMPFLGAIDSLTIVPLLIKSGLNNVVAYTLFGLEDGIVASLVAMPTVFATSFGQSLVPSITKNNAKNSTKNIAESFKIVWLLGIACAFVFLFFSGDIINFLYAGGLNNKIVLEADIAKDLIKLNAFNIIYLSLLNLSSSILQGLEDSKTPVKNMAVCAVVRVAVVLLMVSAKGINIYGTAIADMVFYSLVFLLNMRAVKKKIDIKFSASKLVVLPVVSATAMCLTMQLFKLVFAGLVSARVTTLVMGVAGICMYFLLLVLTKVINIKNITQMAFKKRQKT